MFAIYDSKGRRFRDTLENLRKVRALHGRPEMQLRSNVSEDETQTIPVATGGKLAQESGSPFVAAWQGRVILQVRTNGVTNGVTS